MPEKTYRDLLPVIVECEGATLPEGCDSWGIKSVHPDLRTTHDYQWPLPGGVATCDPDRIMPATGTPLPTMVAPAPIPTLIPASTPTGPAVWPWQ